MNHEDKQDEQIHENLRILAKRCSRPRDAGPEQIQRWVRLTEKPKRARILHFADIFRRHPIAGCLSSGAAAAIPIEVTASSLACRTSGRCRDMNASLATPKLWKMQIATQLTPMVRPTIRAVVIVSFPLIVVKNFMMQFSIKCQASINVCH